MHLAKAISLILPLALQLSSQKVSPPTLTQALGESRSPLVLASGRFSGAGAEVLAKAVADSRFVLIGEEHLTREIPAFVSALCDSMHPDAYAIEAGPNAASFVSALFKSPDRIQQTAALMKLYPDSIAFLNVREENNLAAYCAASSSNAHFALWGLDQEFLGAAGTLLDGMAASGNGPKAKAVIEAAQAKERSKEAEARRTGDAARLFLLSSSDGDIKELANGINADGSGKQKNLLKELIVSRRIYGLNLKGAPDSNRVRSEVLKQHFLADYLRFKETVPSPRVLFKFGDNHMGKGFNALHQRDLGNFVAELADAEQTRSLHICIMAARGTLPSYAGYAKPARLDSFVLADMPQFSWMTPALQEMLPAYVGDAGTVATLFDLRKLRFQEVVLPEEWQRLIYSYDLLIVEPQFSPASGNSLTAIGYVVKATFQPGVRSEFQVLTHCYLL